MAAHAGRIDQLRPVPIFRILSELRPAGLEIDMTRPIDGHVFVRREQLAGLAIQDVEETVLRRLHQDLAFLAFDGEIGQHHRLDGSVVPAFMRHFLVIPDHPAGIGVDRQDRGEEQIVTAGGAAFLPIEQGRIAGADIEEIELGVVDHRVPGRTAAADVPAAVRIPGLRGHFELGILDGFLWIGRHDEEAPLQVAGLQVIGRNIAACVIVRAGIADHHDVARDLGRAAARIGAVLVDKSIDLPNDLAGLGVEPEEMAVERADIDHAVPHRDAAIDFVATGIAIELAVAMGIEIPDFLPRPGVERINPSVDPGRVQHAVDLDRRRLEPAIGLGVVIPSEAEPRDGVGVDLCER